MVRATIINPLLAHCNCPLPLAVEMLRCITHARTYVHPCSVLMLSEFSKEVLRAVQLGNGKAQAMTCSRKCSQIVSDKERVTVKEDGEN